MDREVAQAEQGINSARARGDSSLLRLIDPEITDAIRHYNSLSADERALYISSDGARVDREQLRREMRDLVERSIKTREFSEKVEREREMRERQARRGGRAETRNPDHNNREFDLPRSNE
jgi:hypothetical protein